MGKSAWRISMIITRTSDTSNTSIIIILLSWYFDGYYTGKFWLMLGVCPMNVDMGIVGLVINWSSTGLCNTHLFHHFISSLYIFMGTNRTLIVKTHSCISAVTNHHHQYHQYHHQHRWAITVIIFGKKWIIGLCHWVFKAVNFSLSLKE